MSKKKLIEEQISGVIDDLDYNSTVLNDIKETAHQLQEEIDGLRLLKKDLEKQNKELEKRISKVSK